MRKFGLIGYPLTHSFSRKYFSEKFQRENIRDCLYENFPIPSIHDLQKVFQENEDLNGLNVTIPYKEQVIPFLDHQHETVTQIGACNCISIRQGKLHGFNTDAPAFEQCLKKKLQPHHRRALILGTGGASKAVAYVLKKSGIDYVFVSRNPRPGSPEQMTYGDINASLVRSHQLIVNTTPVGMFPAEQEYPPLPYAALTPDHYLFDLIYNPAKTVFLQKGEERGAAIENGSEMLVLQAEESWKIWNSIF